MPDRPPSAPFDPKETPENWSKPKLLSALFDAYRQIDAIGNESAIYCMVAAHLKGTCTLRQACEVLGCTDDNFKRALDTAHKEAMKMMAGLPPTMREGIPPGAAG